MNSIPSNNSHPDVINLVATFGASLLVVSLLVYRIINGSWVSVAFMAIVFVIVFVFYVGLVPFDNDDEQRLTECVEDERKNDAE